jgi:hypothetical protein
MNRREIYKALLEAYGEGKGRTADLQQDPEVRRLTAAARALRAAAAGAEPAPPPKSLRDRVLAAVRPPARRRRWPAWAAAAAAVVVGLALWGSLRPRPAQRPTPSRIVQTQDPVYNEQECERQFAAAAALAREVSATVLGDDPWLDDQFRSLRQAIETLGEYTVEPAAELGVGSQPATQST